MERWLPSKMTVKYYACIKFMEKNEKKSENTLTRAMIGKKTFHKITGQIVTVATTISKKT